MSLLQLWVHSPKVAVLREVTSGKQVTCKWTSWDSQVHKQFVFMAQNVCVNENNKQFMCIEYSWAFVITTGHKAFASSLAKSHNQKCSEKSTLLLYACTLLRKQTVHHCCHYLVGHYKEDLHSHKHYFLEWTALVSLWIVSYRLHMEEGVYSCWIDCYGTQTRPPSFHYF